MNAKVAAIAAAITLSIVGLIGIATTGSAATGPCQNASGAPTKVMWIWFENHGYSQIIGSSSAPYFNQLASQCALATDYHAITHPSLPNYIAASAGDTLGFDGTDCSPSSSCETDATSIWSQRPGSKTYAESMPSNCYKSNSGDYAPRHNPQLYFTNVRSYCANNNVPMGTPSSGKLRTDLNAGTLRPFSLVVPNVCSDMHDCSVSTGDNWLKALLPVILAAPDYQAGRLAVFVVFDEDNGNEGNRVVALAVSPYTAPGRRVSTALSHYSLLKVTERIVGRACLRAACTANPMGAML